jgi:succinate dehydrogenase cytochrome b556 subunit
LRAWTWIIQRASGAVLVLALGLHWIVQHVVSPGAEITFSGVQVRLQWALYLASDLTLLGFAVFHGLNGLRTVLLDFNPSGRVAAWSTTALVVLGAAAVLYGFGPILAFLGR